jgi:hypothetical protein
MKIVTDFKDMQFLTTAPIVALDIETQTTAPQNSPASGIKKYGLSYVADIIAISLSAGPNHPTAVFLDLETYTTAEREQLREFLIRVICRDVLIVGHNVLFDLRSIGGHFGFTLPIQTRVWDTLPMTRRLLLIDAEASNPKLRKLGADVFEFGLLPISKKWGLVSPDEEAFLDFMKKQRGKIGEFLVTEEDDDQDSNMIAFVEPDEEDEDPETDVELEADQEIVDAKKVKTLRDLKPNDPIWAFANGYAPNKYDEKNRILLQKYVAYDAYLSFQIYEKQNAFVKVISTLPQGKTHSPFPGVNLPRWEKLPQLVESYTDQLRISANFAILGVPVDMKYLEKRIAETASRTHELAPMLFNTEDPTDAFPMYKEIYSQLMWYAQILDTIREGKKYSTPTKWVNWEKIHLDPSLLADALIFDADDEGQAANLRQLWAEWLVDLSPEITRGQVIKEAPTRQLAPKLDLVLWVWQTCFAHRKDLTELQGWYLAMLKSRWLNNFYRFNKKQAEMQMVNSKFWKPYYLFVLAGWPLYSHEDLMFNFDLGTKGFQKERDRREKNGETPNLQTLCIEKDAFSCGKKPLVWIFKIIETMTEAGTISDHPEYLVSAEYLKPFQELLTQAALNKRLIEYHQHAQRDGRIHSILSPNTQTGRDTSTLPNLQNIDLKAMAGVFSAPEGMTFLELDISNAEINMGAMVSMDTNLAEAVGGDDYHWYWAQIYWPKETREIIEQNDLKRKKALRTNGKQATFAIPYGAGYKKLASLLRTDGQTAKETAARIAASFPMVTQKKKLLGDQCQKRVKVDKWFPAYTTLWNGERVMVDSVKGAIQTYTIWNYQLQGGVAAIIHGAIIAIERMLWERGYKSHLLLNVHDSLILAVDNREYFETNVVQEVLQILCSQVPEDKLNGTIPPVDFASETCPSNRFKWGARANGEYPFPINEFINRWGRFKLSDWVNLEGKKEKDWEAPTWKGPKHLGWTFEGNKEQKRREKEVLASAPETVVEKPVEKPKPDMSGMPQLAKELADLLEPVLSDSTTFYEKLQGGTDETPVLDPEERLRINEELAKRGISGPLKKQLQQIQDVRDWLQKQSDLFTRFLDEYTGDA